CLRSQIELSARRRARQSSGHPPQRVGWPASGPLHRGALAVALSKQGPPHPAVSKTHTPVARTLSPTETGPSLRSGPEADADRAIRRTITVTDAPLLAAINRNRQGGAERGHGRGSRPPHLAYQAIPGEQLQVVGVGHR